MNAPGGLMRRLRAFCARLAGSVNPGREDREDQAFDEEVRIHLTLLEERFARQGMDPDAARDAARLAFGGVARTRELHRAVRSWPWLDEIHQDVRHALRMLRQAPSFVVLSTLTLGIGIGATTAVFTQINAVFITKLPVEHPDALRRLHWSAPDYRFAGPAGHRWQASTLARASGFSRAAFEYVRDHTASFAGVACYTGRTLVFDIAGAGEIPAILVSASYFDTFGVRPVIGRGITTADVDSGAHVAVISERFWDRHLGRDPEVLGRTLRVNGRMLSIVGVTPRKFFGYETDRPIGVMIPSTLYRDTARLTHFDTDPWSFCSGLVARLKPGITDQQAEAETGELLRQAVRAGYPGEDVSRIRVELENGARGSGLLRSTTAVTLPLVLAGTGVLLLIACSSVAGLLLARGAAREKEIATRLALGAARGRVVRQLLVESLLLAGASGLAGIALAYALTPLLPVVLSQLSVGNVGLELDLDGRVLATAIALTVATGVIFGILPALRTTSVDLLVAMRPGASGHPGNGLRLTGGRAVVIAQVALSLVLLVGAGLFVRSIANVQANWGYAADGVVRFSLQIDPRHSTDIEAMVRRLEQMPGVSSATASIWGIWARNHPEQSLRICVPGAASAATGDARVVIEPIAPGFFATWGVPLVAGREFEWRHLHADERVAIVNESFVRTFVPDGDAWSRPLRVGACPGVPFTVVALAADSTDDPRSGAVAMVYLPLHARHTSSPTFAVRTHGDSRALVGPLRALSEDLRMRLGSQIMTGLDLQARYLQRDRLLAALLSGFAATAMLVAGLGLYGLLAYSVSRRLPEIGIRLALGASRPTIVSTVVRESLLPVIAGVTLGTLLAMLFARLIESLLFGVSGNDLRTLAPAAAILLATAVLASVTPAARALRVDPIATLRCE